MKSVLLEKVTILQVINNHHASYDIQTSLNPCIDHVIEHLWSALLLSSSYNTTDKGWSSTSVVGGVITTGHREITRHYTCKVTLRRVRVIFLPWKSNTCYIFVCAYVRAALLILHSTRMRHVVTSFGVPLTAPYFSTLSKNDGIFGKVIVHKMCVLIFSTTFV